VDTKDVYGDDFPGENVPRAEGEGDAAVRGVSDEKVGVGETE